MTDTGPATSVPVWAPLRRPRVRRLVGGQFLAELGDGIVLVALPLFVFAETGSELATSLAFAAEMGLGIVFAVLGGMASDRYDRRRNLLISYTVRAALLTITLLALPLIVVAVVAIVARALGQGDNPSFDALLPDHAEGDLQQILALRRSVQAASFLVGPAIGALLVSLIGPSATLALPAAGFLLAGLAMASLPGIDLTFAERRAGQDERIGRTQFVELAKGMSVIVTTPVVRRLVGYNVAVFASVGLAMATAVVWYEVDLDAPEWWYGLAIAGYGIGATLGIGWAGSRNWTMSLPRVLLTLAPIYATCCIIGVIADLPWLMPLGWLLWGIATGPDQVLGELTFVNRIPEAARGRAFAGLNVVISGGQFLGFLVAGPALELTNARITTIGTAIFVLVTGTVWLGPALRNERPTVAPDPTANV